VEEEKAAGERRKQQQVEMKAAKAQADAEKTQETAMLDSILEKLRNGESVKGRNKRSKPSIGARPTPAPLIAMPDFPDARGMLEALQSGGFQPSQVPTSPTKGDRSIRRARLRNAVSIPEEGISPEFGASALESPLNSPPAEYEISDA